MKIDTSKINWKKVIQIGGCVVTGVAAFCTAIDEKNQAEKIAKFEERLSNLEKK